MRALTRQPELESIADLTDWLSRHRSLAGVTLQSIDLTAMAPELAAVDVTGALLLGCTLDEQTEADLKGRGALVFPRLPHLPFDPYRAGLYSPDQLYAGLDQGYTASLDGRVYGWFGSTHARALPGELAMTLHDHAIEDVLSEVDCLADPHRCVGIMGGHALRRDDPGFVAAARLAHRLASGGLTVLTGGGPGAMEAANLGAALRSERDADTELAALCEHLARVPTFTSPAPGTANDRHHSPTAWARQAFVVRERADLGGPSVGIPTWFYGHEPPNAFAGQIAKYFSNALREDTLLRRCRAGLLYLPGAAGTVQEIFQATTASYYAADPDQVTPMVLVGVDHWTRRLPAWPLLRALGECRELGRRLHLVDTIDEAGELLLNTGLQR